MRLAARILVAVSLAFVIALVTVWAALALWYRLPFPELAKAVTSGAFILLGLVAIVALFTRWRYRAGAVFLVALGVMLAWWSTIRPPKDADWAPDVARQVTGTLNGNLLTLTNVRDFEWRSNSDFTERWTTRTYDLDKLRSLDLFMSYWAGPEMAHVIMSFGFEGGDQLAWSIEVKRRIGGQFSPVADLFKSNPLVIVAADERDVVRVRSNVRGEDVQIYRLRAPPEAAKTLLLEYVRDANALATTPEFYNSITTNCTTTIVKMMRAVGDVVPGDWRLIVNGYLPDYAYDRGAVDTSMPLTELRSLAHIKDRAQAAGLSPDFSGLIRVGVPSPPQRPR
ncbi:DUF4105 domain-containing protein [Sinorhizobium mexicanum]|uniref:DUF4105 domain-containing protein n=1 Tax=Sinorhizobium mexicanum TaxID=375549 RepID=A0A859QCP3_9HYPH|nr:DUF4105 domain-containing protein [Sinorhizobium mexicanum]MBP1887428.1 hypothetical protein [Sinorhizobium mexicanum]QLL62323.1 DUF4105 domain-containing protein [Sinorhizobium mexicanum]